MPGDRLGDESLTRGERGMARAKSSRAVRVPEKARVQEHVATTPMEALVVDGQTATDELMVAVLEVAQFQKDRGYEAAGYKTWKECEENIAEVGFKRSRKDFDRMVKDAQLFSPDLVRVLGPSKLKAAARLHREGKWNDTWEEFFLRHPVAEVLSAVREELRKVFEDRKWIRMAVPMSLAELWDTVCERMQVVNQELTSAQAVFEVIVAAVAPMSDEEMLHYFQHGESPVI
jgi:hypothetical protein